MSCCVSLVYYLKKRLDNFGDDFDKFLNKILEIDNNNDYNLIDLEDEKKNNKDYVSINIPIENDYDLI